MVGEKRVSLSDRLPFWHFDGDLMVYGDGSLGAGFCLRGVDLAAASIETVNEFTRAVETWLSTAEVGLRFQVFYRLTPSVGGVIDAHEALTGTSPTDSYTPVAQARMRLLRESAAGGAYVH